MMSKREYLPDFLAALKYGAVLAGICSALLFLGGFLLGGFSLYQGISFLRSGMCMISGLILFLIAGMILMKKHRQVKEDSKWRKKFHKLNYGSVIGIIALLFILCAAAADALLYIV